MRLITPREVEKLEVTVDLPLELESTFFPVALKVFKWWKDKELADLRDDDCKELLQKCAEKLNCRDLTPTDPTKYRRPILQEAGASTFRFPDNVERLQCLSQFVLFPLKQLLFEEQLTPLGITAQPGYLYFGCQIVLEKTDRWSGRQSIADDSRSILKHEMPYSHWRSKYSDRYHELIRESYSSDKKADKKAKKDPTSFEEICSWLADSGVKFRGPISDIEFATNSCVLHERINLRERSYVLMTPFEIPKGFVRETYEGLKRELGSDSPIVLRFGELISETINPDHFGKQNEDLSELFPIPIEERIGPDKAWKYSSAPFYVQTILLARIVGGSLWHYALGELEGLRNRSLDSE